MNQLVAKRLILCGVLTLTLVPSANYAALIESLGDIPGGAVESRAFAISGDGAIVGGDSQARDHQGDDVGSEAFVWTQDGGVVGIGGLPGRPCSVTRGLSADGDSGGWLGQGRRHNRHRAGLPVGYRRWDEPTSARLALSQERTSSSFAAATSSDGDRHRGKIHIGGRVLRHSAGLLRRVWSALATCRGGRQLPELR